MKMCSKIVARILQDLFLNSPILQDLYFYEKFAKVALIAGILQDFCKNCFSCELGYAVTRNNPMSSIKKSLSFENCTKKRKSLFVI